MISTDAIPDWAHSLSADEYDDGEEDGGWLDDMERTRTGRRRHAKMFRR